MYITEARFVLGALKLNFVSIDNGTAGWVDSQCVGVTGPGIALAA